jgi:arsenate reductase
MRVVMTHNPDCGTSRNVLSIVQACGYEPEVIPYLETGWTRPQLQMILAAADLSAREALRTTKSPAEALGLLDPALPDEAILDAMVAHPVLVNRPFVFTPLGTRLCRPSETVLGLLDRRPPGPILREDGTPVPT